MKQTSMTSRVNGRAYTFAPAQCVPYLFRPGTRRVPPLSCEAHIVFVSADETAPLIRIRFFHPRLHTEETRWLTGNQFWRVAPGPAAEWLHVHPPPRPAQADSEAGWLDREQAEATLRVGKRISKRLDLLRGRDLVHLLTNDERTFLTRGYGPVRGYYLGPYTTRSGLSLPWQEQQLRGRAFEELRNKVGLSVHAFALLDTALLELHHVRAVENVLTAFYRPEGSDRASEGEEAWH